MRTSYLSLTAVFLAGCVLCQSPPLNLTHCPTEPGGAPRPVFSANISDSTPVGTPLLVFSSRLSISLHNSCRADIFSLNSNAFILNKALKHVCIDSLSCQLICQVAGDTSDARYEVFLQFQLSRNENYTLEFKQNNYHAIVSELISDMEIFRFNNEISVKECQDISLTFSARFTIIQNPTPGWFSDNGGTTEGIIRATSLVDYDLLNDTNNVTLTIKAALLQPSLIANRNVSASTNLIVTIQDVDDTGPVFKDNVYELNVTEENDAIIGIPQSTFPPIFAYDGDRGLNKPVLYSIEGNMSNTFSINNTTGMITVLKRLDADSNNQYVVVIKAMQEDNRLKTASATLFVSVTDIDDNPPVFSPNKYIANITEHSAVGQFILRVTATDKDKGQYGQFKYEIEHGSAVAIDPISGDITVNDSQKLDREQEPRIYIQIVAKSSDGNKTDKANVTINLIDINDNSPKFDNSSYNFIVRNISNGEYVGKIKASDLDSGDYQNLNYTKGRCLSNIGVCNGDNTKCQFPFLIDPESGNITLNGSTAGCIYTTLVSACDSPHSSSSLCSSTLLIIRVENNSTHQVFNRTSSVQENVANNSLVAQIPSQCQGNSITCHEGPVFRLDTESNMVMTNDSIDYEISSHYSCFVSGYIKQDTGSCTVLFNITVIDLNDNVPVFSNNTFLFKIPKDDTSGHDIGQVRAQDIDEDGTQTVTYYIQESSEMDLFQINLTNGMLQVKDIKDLSRDYYQLSIVAHDSGKPPLKSNATVLLYKYDPQGNLLPLSTTFSKDEIKSKQTIFEGKISEILNVTVSISIDTVDRESQKEVKGYKIYIDARRNGTSLLREELMRLILRHSDPLMSYLMGNNANTQFVRGNGDDSSMTAPVIALISIACVLFIGGFIAIIVIRRQYNGHQRYKRLYENLTKHSSLYESQELKVNMEDATSDYNGSVNTQDLENSDASKPSDLITSSLNPLYGLDTSSSPSVADAMLSLSELSDRLTEEENIPKPDYENVPSKFTFENVLEQACDPTAQDTGEFSSTETPRTPSDNANVPRSESPTPDYDQQDGRNENVNIDLEQNVITLETQSEIASNSLKTDHEKNNEETHEEPQPDYEKKQVRFAHQVLDPDENKMTPLRTGDEEKDGDNHMNFDPTLENTKVEQSGKGKYVVPTLDLAKGYTDEPTINVSDETGWLEEEINSPSDIMTVDDKENEFFEEEVTSL